VNLISLTLVFIFLTAGLCWGYSQFVVTDAARSAARMLARGETGSNIESAIHQRYPRVRIGFEVDQDLVAVKATLAPWSPPLLPEELTPAMSATAVADIEGWGAPTWQ